MRAILSCRRVNWPLLKPLTTQGLLRHREVLELRLELPTGVGLGEAAPLPGLHDESLADVEASLDGLPGLMADMAANVDPLDALRDLEDRMRARHCPPSLLWAMGWSLVQSLGWEPAVDAGGDFPRSAGLLAGEPEEWVAAAVLEAGRSCWKVKIGRHGAAREARGLRDLRDALPAAELRLDANRAYDLEEGLAFMRRCPDLAPRWIEEPLADGSLLRRWRELGAWPLALDESMLEEGVAAIEMDHAAAWVLKPQLLGLGRVLGLLARSRPPNKIAASGPLCVISSSFESPRGLPALQRLSRLAPGRPAPGLGTDSWFAPAPAEGPWRRVGRSA